MSRQRYADLELGTAGKAADEEFNGWAPGRGGVRGLLGGQGPLYLGVSLCVYIFTSIRVVPPAHVAVMATFGSVEDAPATSGFHIRNPFVTAHTFVTKTQLLEQDNHVPTREGLSVDLDVAILFHIKTEMVRDIYLSMGENYVSVVIEPELSSAVRGLTSESEAKALYTSDRTMMQKKLQAELQTQLDPRGIVIENVLLKAVRLPQQLTHSIELKAQAEQESARMEFVLSKEKQEADRKAIEAKGVAEFQRIVSEGISPNLLQWKGIEATAQIANSPNSKVIVVGNSKGDLPVILSAADPISQPRPQPNNAPRPQQHNTANNNNAAAASKLRFKGEPPTPAAAY